MVTIKNRSRSNALRAMRIAAPIVSFVILLTLIASLVNDVRNGLRAVEASDSDNGQWVMIQSEVEVLRFQNSLSAARTGSQSLADVRRWYDVLYSRLTLLSQSPLYSEFIQQPENLHHLVRMQTFMDRWVSVIDGPDDELFAALSQIEQENLANQVDARSLSLNALLSSSKVTDATRAKISETLIGLAITTLATFLLLALLAIMLMRLYRFTRRQAMENEQTGARLQMIIASSPDAIVVTNRGGWAVEFNPVAEQMFGIKREDMLNQVALPKIVDPAQYIEIQTVISAAIRKAADDGPQRIEIEGMRADGSKFPLEIAIAAKDLARGALIIAFMRDVSARHASDRALQDALTKARAGEKAKAEFLAVMSHEMRTPLNGLIGSIDLMGNTKLDVGQEELLRIMAVSGDILLGHVNSVLDISRSEAGKVDVAKVDFDLDQLIDDCISNQAGLAMAAGNSLTVHRVTGSLGFVHGDPSRVRRILLNLIGNAVKFTKDGSITLETERQPSNHPDKSGGIVEFRVVDTGIGIAPEDQERVFQDFQTLDASYERQASGTGLGLGIARRLATAMGGSIGLESEVGLGSVFWLRLPLPPVATPPSGKKTGRPAQKSKATVTANTPLDILIIEDNEINRFLLRQYLAGAGHKVTEAADGVEGLAAAEGRYFDVIITDISMPRMNGIEVTKAIRSGSGPSAQTRIIALTAHALPEEVERFSKAGIDECLAKPVAREVLMSHLLGSPAQPLVPGDAVADVVEKAALDELAAALGQDMVENLIGRMIDDGDKTVEKLAGFASPDDDVAKIVHQLAGSCATFGAVVLRTTLAMIETSIKRGDMDTASQNLAQLPHLWEKTRDALLQYKSA